MNILPLSKRTQVIHLLVEGNSLRATSRLADVNVNTVMKLLATVGEACAKYQNTHLRNLPCKRLQVDEIWSFCYAKAKNVPEMFQGVPGFGDVWTWTAIDPDTKLVPSWFVGSRDALAAKCFMLDLAKRITGRPQLYSDGFNAYPEAVHLAFGKDVDYGILMKIYGDKDGKHKNRYRGAERYTSLGACNPANIGTSIVERQNLTMRTNIKRFTRRTNAHSKKLQNHGYAVGLHFMHYNFARIHSTLRVTPAMAAGVTDHIWSIEDMVRLVPEPIAKKRGPYKKSNSN